MEIDAQFNAQQTSMLPPKDRTRGWRARLVSMGHLNALLAITGFSVLASLALTALMISWFYDDIESFIAAMIIATVVPSVVAPVASHLMMKLLFELEKAHAQLSDLANRDSLTQIYNRRFFMDQLALASARAARTGEPLSLLMIDADKFKLINDQHGHVAGDSVLQAIARNCSALLRPYDTFARFGGEEFAVLLPNTASIVACEIAERLRLGAAALRINTGDGLNTANAATITVTLSLGVSTLNASDEDFKQLIYCADSALYEAKGAGRNRVMFKA